MDYEISYLTTADGKRAQELTVGSSPGTQEFALPENFTVCNIYVTINGDSTTDASTFLEGLASLGTFELDLPNGTGQSGDWKSDIDWDDFFEFPGWLGEEVGSFTIGAAADKEMQITGVIPLSLSPRKWLNRNGQVYGYPGKLGGTLRLALGTDTAAGADSRELTVMAEGVKNAVPVGFRSVHKLAHTSVANEVKVQRLNAPGVLSQILIFTTTNFNVDTAATVFGVRNVQLLAGETIYMDLNTKHMTYGQRMALIDDPLGEELLRDETIFKNFDIGLNGWGLPIGNPVTQVGYKGGTAEAVRPYTMLYRKVSL